MRRVSDLSSLRAILRPGFVQDQQVPHAHLVPPLEHDARRQTQRRARGVQTGKLRGASSAARAPRGELHDDHGVRGSRRRLRRRHREERRARARRCPSTAGSELGSIAASGGIRVGAAGSHALRPQSPGRGRNTHRRATRTERASTATARRSRPRSRLFAFDRAVQRSPSLLVPRRVAAEAFPTSAPEVPRARFADESANRRDGDRQPVHREQQDGVAMRAEALGAHRAARRGVRQGVRVAPASP